MAIDDVAEIARRRLVAGTSASDDGRPDRAVRELRAGVRHIDRSGRAGEPDLVALRARLLVSLAWAESERGRVDAGFAMLDQAEAVVDPADRAVLVAQRALMLSRAGRDEEAIERYDAAVGLLAESSHPLDLARALNNRSLVHLDAGRVAAARADLHRSAAIARRHGLALHEALASVNLGCIDVLVGDLPAALGAFAEARRTYELLAPGRLPSLAVERARALLAAGLFTAADRELGYAVEQAEQQRLSFTLADALLARAQAALVADRPDAVARFAAQARSRFVSRHNQRRAALASLLELRARSVPSSGAALRLAERLRLLAMAEDAREAELVAVRSFIRSGRPASARRLIEAQRPPGPRDRLDTRLLWRLSRAELAEATGRPADAGRQLVAGLHLLRRHRAQFGSLDLQTGASALGRDVTTAGLRLALESASPAAVLRWSERSRAQALLLPPVHQPDDPEVATTLAELRQARSRLRTAELDGRTVPGLARRVERLEAALRERSWSTPVAPGVSPSGVPWVTGSEPVTVAGLRGLLGDAALVSYVRRDAELLALVVTRSTIGIVSLGSYDDAVEAAQRLRIDLDTRAGRLLPPRLADALVTATRHDADVLQARCLDPLLHSLGGRELVVVPTGPLFAVPWSALAALSGRPVTVTPSATAWTQMMSRQRETRRTARTGVVLVAGPGTRRGEAEIDAVARFHPGSQVLVGPDATPAAVIDAFARADLAHVAAHGHHQAENALFSRLDLHAGPLFGYDLQQKTMPSTVILSCCDLGRSDVRPGDEMLGMAAALMASGTATVVASTAKVGDDAALEVMKQYHRAASRGVSAAQALAEATAGQSEPTGFVCLGAG